MVDRSRQGGAAIDVSGGIVRAGVDGGLEDLGVPAVGEVGVERVAGDVPAIRKRKQEEEFSKSTGSGDRREGGRWTDPVELRRRS